MKWVLLMTVVYGYNSPATLAVEFDDRQACVNAIDAKAQAYREFNETLWTGPGARIVGAICAPKGSK